MMNISPTHAYLRTMGRVNNTSEGTQIWVFPYTQTRLRCTGTQIGVRLINHHHYGNTYIGVIIDGMESKVRVESADTEIDITLAQDLPDIEHDIIIFKRQDGQHHLEIISFLLDDTAKLLPCPELPNRKIEIFGDSISCGERNEALLYSGQPDPEVDLSAYSNAWWSYGAIAARELNAQLHDIAQGGIALYDGIGWFDEPDYMGMESVWNSIQYNRNLGSYVPWNTQQYEPNVVLIAIGQNDSHPADFMACDYNGDLSAQWRERYAQFLRNIREAYPHAHIICATSIMTHNRAWDRAIADVIKTLDDSHISQLLYTRNGSGTPGHPRIAEHKSMARELVEHINALGSDIWN
ncbi:GDSL-type esterase/lipase family protein [Alloscardovia omnicolens]|uniref:GDSL-type esterase/lipase family protein n=1 Tax=Alloscardovia omnicolens TaxID=419015 RepID=UPI003A6ECB42